MYTLEMSRIKDVRYEKDGGTHTWLVDTDDGHEIEYEFYVMRNSLNPQVKIRINGVLYYSSQLFLAREKDLKVMQELSDFFEVLATFEVKKSLAKSDEERKKAVEIGKEIFG